MLVSSESEAEAESLKDVVRERRSRSKELAEWVENASSSSSAETGSDGMPAVKVGGLRCLVGEYLDCLGLGLQEGIGGCGPSSLIVAKLGVDLEWEPSRWWLFLCDAMMRQCLGYQ